MKLNGQLPQLKSYGALHQSIVAVVLMTIIPLLSILYMGALIWFQAERRSIFPPLFIFILMVILASVGFLMLLKFPRNIIRLRRYIADVAGGGAPRTCHFAGYAKVR